MKTESGVHVDITLTPSGNPPGKLADAALHFTDGPLDGWCIVGIGVWEKRENRNELSVTFPQRQFISHKGEKRSFNVMRLSDPNKPDDTASSEVKNHYYAPLHRLRKLVTDAYQQTIATPPDGPAPAAPTDGPDADDIPF